MVVVAFDIETVADINRLSYKDHKYLKERFRCDTDEELEKSIAFCPYLVSVVSVALVFIEKDAIKNAVVYFLADKSKEIDFIVNYGGLNVPVKFVSFRFDLGKEYEFDKYIIEKFWETVIVADRIVSYNGKGFDLPVLRIKSFIHGIKPQIDMSILRGSFIDEVHIDLMAFLSNNNAKYSYSLDFICKCFDIPSPKVDMEGSMVKERFYNGDYINIAEYNLYDSISTAMLYLRLLDYMPTALPTEEQIKQLQEILFKINAEAKLMSESGLDCLNGIGEVLTKSKASDLISLLESVLGNEITSKQIEKIKDLIGKNEENLLVERLTSGAVSRNQIRLLISYLDSILNYINSKK